MVQILNSIPEYKVSNSGLKQEDVQNTIAKSKQAVSDNFESNSVGKTVSGNMTDPENMKKTLLLLPPLIALDKLVDKTIGKTDGKGLFNKVAAIGDKISHALHLDKIISDESGSRLSNFLKNNRFTKYFTKDYKAIPKSSLAKGMTLSEKYSQELVSVLSAIKNDASYAHLFEAGEGALSAETIEFLSSLAQQGDKVSAIPKEKIISATDEVISKGVKSVQEKGIIPKTKNLSVLNNKLRAAENKIGQTGLGKIFAKGTLKTKDLLTYGGGILGLAFAANAIVQAVKATKEAPKGEKKATFMHVLSEQYLGILLFQPSINMLYKAGGNKYRGMSVEGRNALKELIQKVNSDSNLTKEGYKVAKMQKNLLLRGVDKEKVAQLTGKGVKEAKTLFKSLKNSGEKIKLWERPLKAAGRLLNTGLDKIKNPSALGKIKDKIKGFGGGLGRFLIIMMVLQPLLQKPVTKLCHKIFGKPETYLKNHGGEDKKNKNTKAEENIPAQQIPVAVPERNDIPSNETNLLKRYENQNQNDDANKINASQPVNETVNEQYVQPVKPQRAEEIPALNIFKKDDSEEERYYIPSIKVDTSYTKKQDKELEKEVDEFIKQKNKALKH